MSWLYIIFHIIPLYREYRIYLKMVKINTQIIYTRRRKNRDLDWAREYLARNYLERNYLTFFEWLKAVR